MKKILIMLLFLVGCSYPQVKQEEPTRIPPPKNTVVIQKCSNKVFSWNNPVIREWWSNGIHFKLLAVKCNTA